MKVVSQKASLLIVSSDVQKDLKNQPARLSRLRQAVEADSASPVARYLLARAYRDQGVPLKTMQVLDPIIKNDFRHVRAFVEYTRAMLETGATIGKSEATLSVCRLDGESDPAYIGLYGGLLYLNGKFGEAQKLWDDAKELNFSDEERTRRQFVPMDLEAGRKRRFVGSVVHTKPTYLIIQPDERPTVISKDTAVKGKVLDKGQRVEYELSFSAKSPLAEHLRVV